MFKCNVQCGLLSATNWGDLGLNLNVQTMQHLASLAAWQALLMPNSSNMCVGMPTVRTFVCFLRTYPLLWVL